MASDVSICNAALVLLGDKVIASLDETTPRAILCNSLYEQAKADILRMHPWNCLVTRAELAPTTDEAPGGWGYVFNLPGDWLRTLSVGEDDDQPDEYVMEGRKVYADVDTLYLRYLADKAEALWDAHLVDVLTKRMTADLAYPITKSASVVELREQKLAQALKQAKAVDGQENPPESWGDSTFIAVRG
jgi:hypothetical protein